jgi:hypothetical protein
MNEHWLQSSFICESLPEFMLKLVSSAELVMSADLDTRKVSTFE